MAMERRFPRYAHESPPIARLRSRDVFPACGARPSDKLSRDARRSTAENSLPCDGRSGAIQATAIDCELLQSLRQFSALLFVESTEDNDCMRWISIDWGRTICQPHRIDFFAINRPNANRCQPLIYGVMPERSFCGYLITIIDG
jgi:hypothetical protein